mgnify:CR=1 FL=1
MDDRQAPLAELQRRWLLLKILNDDKTPVDFVVAMFIQVFKHSQTNALDLTVKIHNEGSAVAGIYTHEIAEQKITDATNLARGHGFPLVLKAEAE